MPLNPSKSLHFDSWEKLLAWLPEANESQLMTVFVWSGELKAAAVDSKRLAHVRKETFEHLVARVREPLKRFLLQRVHCQDPHLADDIVQQVLIKLFVRAEQFDPQRSFWGWLYRIARNEYIDALRRQRPGDVGVGQMGPADSDVEKWLDNLAGDAGTAEALALEEEQRHQLGLAIEALPSLQRTIVRLKTEGLKGKEIAQRLGISQAYVSQLFHEASELLRVALTR